MSATLDEAAGTLYAVEPGRFTAERTRLAGEARQAGDTDTAKAIGELRRPTTSAWLMNQLVRGEQGAADEIERLDQVGEELRQAQSALEATRMRELTKERHQLVAALVRRADAVAAEGGQKLSAAVRRELEDTLGAAVADEQASLAVMSGRLTRALTYAGFGEVDISEATATPLSAVHPYTARKNADAIPADRPTATSKTEVRQKQSAEEARSEKLAARRAEAEELVNAAREEVEAAEQTLREKGEELDEATSEQSTLQARLNELQAEVVAVRRKLDAGDRRVSSAEREVQRQERQLKDASKALNRAEAALDRLDPA